MQRFAVFRHDGGEVDVVKQGWSWPGFLFNVLWALWHRMWLLAFGVWVGGMLAPPLLSHVFGALRNAGVDPFPLVFVVGPALGLGVPVAFGRCGNAWRQAHLMARGYARCGTVAAPSAERAKAVFMDSEDALGGATGDG